MRYRWRRWGEGAVRGWSSLALKRKLSVLSALAEAAYNASAQGENAMRFTVILEQEEDGGVDVAPRLPQRVGLGGRRVLGRAADPGGGIGQAGGVDHRQLQAERRARRRRRSGAGRHEKPADHPAEDRGDLRPGRKADRGGARP